MTYLGPALLFALRSLCLARAAQLVDLCRLCFSCWCSGCLGPGDGSKPCGVGGGFDRLWQALGGYGAGDCHPA